MGLTKCNDCNREVSTKAPACPHCGRPKDLQRSTSKAPPTIVFSDRLVFTPSLEEAGINPQIGMLGVVRAAVEVGQWVERGSPLINASYSAFQSPKKSLLNFFHDPIKKRDFVLESPISGLVIGFREELFRLDQPWNTYYLKSAVLPVLIEPENESPQAEWVFRFYDSIGDYLKFGWRSLAYYPGSSVDIRLGEVAGKASNWSDDIAAAEKFNKARINRFEARALSERDTDYIRSVQNLRAKDLQLRDQLVHLALDLP